MNRSFHAVTVCATLGLLSGCSYATEKEVQSLRAEVRETREIAEQAKADAAAAQQLAQSTEVTSKRTEEIVNRSFQRSMYK